MLSDAISCRASIFQNFPGSMPPGLPSRIMLCMLSVFCTLSVALVLVLLYFYDNVNRLYGYPCAREPFAMVLLLFDFPETVYINGRFSSQFYDFISGVCTYHKEVLFVILLYVTVHAKTSLVRTKIEINFITPAYSYIH